MAIRRDARFTAGPYAGQYLVAEDDTAGSIIALVCHGEPGKLEVTADFWFENVEDLEAGMAEDGWAVEWLEPGSLGRPS